MAQHSSAARMAAQQEGALLCAARRSLVVWMSVRVCVRVCVPLSDQRSVRSSAYAPLSTATIVCSESRDGAEDLSCATHGLRFES